MRQEAYRLHFCDLSIASFQASCPCISNQLLGLGTRFSQDLLSLLLQSLELITSVLHKSCNCSHHVQEQNLPWGESRALMTDILVRQMSLQFPIVVSVMPPAKSRMQLRNLQLQLRMLFLSNFLLQRVGHVQGHAMWETTTQPIPKAIILGDLYMHILLMAGALPTTACQLH